MPAHNSIRVAKLVALAAIAATGTIAGAQDSSAGPTVKAATAIFDSEQPLTVTLTANIRRLRGDRGNSAPWRAATISFAEADGKTVVLPVRARTRGIWRLKNCQFPPLTLDFARATSTGSAFYGLDKPKLTNYCRDTDAYEQYVLQEFQLYRIYNLLTPASHRVRLLRVTYADSATGRTHATRYAFFIEEFDRMAQRLRATPLRRRGATGNDLDPHYNALFGVFQYFIANTDFSIWGLHNAELVTRTDDAAILPIAYDFDFAGAVDAPYAGVDPKLSVRKVRDRLFRGYCAPPDEYTRVFALFNEKKDAIYALYRDSIGQLLNHQIVRETLEYYDAFYRTINDPEAARRNILGACLGRS